MEKRENPENRITQGFLACAVNLAQNGKQFKCIYTFDIFLLFSCGKTQKNACWSFAPNPSDFKTNCLEVLWRLRLVCGKMLTLFFLVFTFVRNAE